MPDCGADAAGGGRRAAGGRWAVGGRSMLRPYGDRRRAVIGGVRPAGGAGRGGPFARAHCDALHDPRRIGACYNTRMHYYPGALHMHTRHSDGTGTVDDLAAAARRAGLRWIIITDHDTLAAQSRAGWIDDVLVIVDHEITPDRNHFLALNVNTVVDKTLPPQQFIDAVYAAGGFGIIAHPDERVHNFAKDNYRWDNWMVDGPTKRNGRVLGIELWNAMSDWGEHLTRRNLVPLLLRPELGLSGPSPETLAWWDRLNMAGRRTFGVGGVDAHAFKRRVPWGELVIFPYQWMFRTLTNYLLLDMPLSPDARLATHQVYAALAAGRSYFVNRLTGACPQLDWTLLRNRERYVSGDTVRLADGALVAQIDVGCDAQVQLIHNGRVAARGVRLLRQTITEPGIYRAEAYRAGRNWLYANPVYVEA